MQQIIKSDPACGWCGSRMGKCPVVKVLHKYQARCFKGLGKTTKKLPIMAKGPNTLDKCPVASCKQFVWSQNLGQHFAEAHSHVDNEVAKKTIAEAKKFADGADGKLKKAQASTGLFYKP